MQIQLLGGFDVSNGGRRVVHDAWRLRKAKTLIKLLALEPAHRLHREQIAYQLWPELDANSVRNNLHQVLHAARRALATIGVDPKVALTWHDDLVVLGPDGQVGTDLEDFQHAVEQATASRDGTALTTALRRWNGELLPEDAYEPWVEQHASRIREWRSTLVMRLVEERLAERDPASAVALLTPLVATNPLNEPANRALMQALAAGGRNAEALVLFDRLRDLLQRELAAEPEQHTRQLYRRLLASAAPSVSPVQNATRRTNLPSRLSALIGRERELDAIARILTYTRLLTLTGPGGTGKTTLAVELARRQHAHYRDGVFLIELGAVADSSLVVPQIAQALRLQLPPWQTPIESLIAQLRDRQILIVLDNCEHLIDVCARTVAALLQGCPEVCVLATSRESLRIDGEVSWRTPSLTLPDPVHLPPLTELAAIASVQLFVQRASAVDSHFVLTDDNAAAVAEICYRLDGLPLALELAAACVPVLSPRQIAARLGDALGLLGRGHRVAITRQQTLSGTLSWSHELLASDEQVLFRRLAVFAGSFALEAVEAVCTDGPERPQVINGLGRLVDTSLVLAESRGDVTRFRLQETVRQYAAEKLREAGEESKMGKRHCDWYVAFAEAHDPEPARDAAGVVPASLDVEHDNLRAAMAWALRRDPAMALRLAVALWRYWLARGFFAEGCRWLEAVLAAAPEPSVMRAQALLALAVFDVRRGTDHRLAQIGAETVAVNRTQRNRGALALALAADAVLAYMRGSWTECWARSAQAREEATGRDTDEIEGLAAHLQALVLLARGQLSAARVAFDQARRALANVSTARPFFTPLLLGFAVEGMATSHPRLYFEETMLVGPRVNAAQAQGYVLCNMAYLARLSGNLDEARQVITEASSAFTTIGDRYGEALAANHLGCLYRVSGEYPAGRAALEHSLQLRHAIGDRRASGLTLSNLGVLTAAQGDAVSGLAMVQQAQASFRETEDTAARVGAGVTLASVHAIAGDYNAALGMLIDALPESWHIPGTHRVTAWAYAMLSDVHRHLGRPDEAAEALHHARDRFDALGAVDGIAHVRAVEGVREASLSGCEAGTHNVGLNSTVRRGNDDDGSTKCGGRCHRWRATSRGARRGDPTRRQWVRRGAGGLERGA